MYFLSGEPALSQYSVCCGGSLASQNQTWGTLTSLVGSRYEEMKTSVSGKVLVLKQVLGEARLHDIRHTFLLFEKQPRCLN